MTDEGKLTRDVMRGLSAASSDEQLPIIVKYAPTRRVMRHRGPMRGVTRGYDFHVRPFAAMRATPEAIRELEADPDVVRIYQDQVVHAYLDSAPAHVQVPLVWGEGHVGTGIRIAIVDTGLDADHPDFEGRVMATADFTGEGPEDAHGHGTHCASIAAGSGAASNGRYRGAAPEALIYAAKVLKANGEGMMSDVMAGVEWAVDQGVQVISLSLGGAGPCNGQDALCETCNAAVEQGIVVCIAGGNDGPSQYTVGSPGCAEDVITVGASDESGHIAFFSSRGPTLDGRTKPDIAIPGVDIVAARAAGTSMGSVVDRHYVSASGTSMATPLVAGICALLVQADPELTPAQIKTRLMQTAIDLGEAPNAQGRGRVDAWRALTNQVSPAPPDPGPTPTPPGPGPAPGEGCLTALLRLILLSRKER